MKKDSNTNSNLRISYYACKSMHWLAPTLEEETNPNRTILTVFVDESFIGGNNISADKIADKTDYQKRILAYLSKHESAKVSDWASKLSLSERRTRKYLSQMIVQGLVVAIESRKFRTYQLAKN